MKTLVLVRHAKSSWKYDVSDSERPLKNRGISDANLISQNFLKFGFNPDFVFSSPANRALSTCRIFLQNLKISDKMLKISDEIYDFGGQSVLHFIRNLDDNLSAVMLFGHNHAFTSISNMLGDKYIDNLPTSGLVMITFKTHHWKTIDSGKTELILIPKSLRT